MNHMDSDLHLAVVSDDTDVLKAKDWLTIGDKRTPTNNTILHLACQHGSIGCVNEILSSHESLLLQTNSRGESALHLAARQGYYDVVEALINKAKSMVPPPNNLENTSTTVLQNLVRASNVEFETALHAAVRYNREGVVELLVKVDPGRSYPQNKYDETPLYLAVVRGYAGVIGIILDNCESPTFDGPDGRTALHASLMSAARDSETNDAWDSVDGNGQNILHIAVMQNQMEVVENLLSGTINFDLINPLLIQRDKEGNTPFHLIAKFGCCFPQLRDTSQWNADWEVVNNANVTPKDVLHQKQTGIMIDNQQAHFGVTIDRIRVQRTWDKWIEDEVQAPYVQSAEEEMVVKGFNEIVNTHIIVAALITTVALTAGFAMPGGFDGNQGPNQGSAVLLRNSAFKTFVVADTLTLLFSISSLFLYFLTSIYSDDLRVVERLFYAALLLNVVSVAAIMVTFIAGTSAVLSQSSGLTVTVCVISSLFLLIVFYACFRYVRGFINVLKSSRSL